MLTKFLALLLLCGQAQMYSVRRCASMKKFLALLLLCGQAHGENFREVIPIPRISGAEVGSTAQFFAKWGDSPVIITGLDISAPIWTFDDLAQTCPADASMPVMVPSDERGRWARMSLQGHTPLPKFLAEVRQPGFSGYGFDFDVSYECPKLNKRFKPPVFAQDDMIGGP